jgi:hypothetical protein
VYPSLGSKSPMLLALSTHGFQTTTLGRLSRVTRKRGAEATAMVSGASSSLPEGEAVAGMRAGV